MTLITMALAAASLFASCKDDVEMIYPPKYELPDLPVVEGVHDNVKAPLYWSVYEYCYEKERQGVTTIDISVEEWDKIIDYVATNLKPHGYDMICTDGFIAMLSTDASGYMTQYGSISLKDLVAKCKAKGLKLGVYDNPLWIHGPRNTKIEGTDYTFGNLYYNGSNAVNNPGTDDKWFHWAVAENPGCKEYIDGFFKHYHDLGVDFIRVDFLSWYEDGNDRGMGTVGRGYGRDCYELALKYMCESATKYGIFLSLVMPHCYKSAELEAKYGHMFRIVRDTAAGGWDFCSNSDRRLSYGNWPNCNNQFDGFVYWSKVAGSPVAVRPFSTAISPASTHLKTMPRRNRKYRCNSWPEARLPLPTSHRQSATMPDSIRTPKCLHLMPTALPDGHWQQALSTITIKFGTDKCVTAIGLWVSSTAMPLTSRFL